MRGDKNDNIQVRRILFGLLSYQKKIIDQIVNSDPFRAGTVFRRQNLTSKDSPRPETITSL